MTPGELAVQKGWITKKKLGEVKKIKEKGDSRRIELILYHKRLISEKQIVELLGEALGKKPSSDAAERALLEDLFLGQMALQKKWLKKKHICRLMRNELELLAENRPRRLLEMAEFEGFMPRDRKEALEEKLAQTVFFCPACLKRIPLAKVTPGSKFKCPRCESLYQHNPGKKKGDTSVKALRSPLYIPSTPFNDPFRPESEKAPTTRYEVKGKLGQGGIGSIYRLYDQDLKRLVALKVMRSDKKFSEKGLERFIREARILARLEHPNIVPVHEIGYSGDGRAYFTMKYVRGTALYEVMEKLRDNDEDALAEYPLERLIQIFLSVCQAIAFAHSRGVIHRDLKPPNIMLGSFGEVLVMDWGLAKLDEEEEKESSPYGDMIDIDEENTRETSEGSIIGTVHYIPPEQVFNRPGEVDERSDIYALGAILYEILTFMPPFLGQTKKEIVQKVLNLPPPDLSETATRKVPDELEAICLKALSKEKENRYQTAMELFEDVSNYVNHQPVLAASTGPLKRIKKWVVRNKIAVVAVLAIFLVVLILSPVLGFALKAALIGCAVVAAAVGAFVFYDEAKRKAVRLERRLKRMEAAKRKLEADLARQEQREIDSF